MRRVRIVGPVVLLFAVVLLGDLPSIAAGRGHGGVPPSWQRPGLAPQSAVPLVELVPVDVERLKREDAVALSFLTKSLRVGWQQKVDLSPRRTAGLIESLGGSERVWRVRVRSPDALWVVLGFGTFRPLPGAALYVYSEDRSTLLGRFTSDDVRDHGQLWLPPIEGDAAVVEIHWTAAGPSAEAPNVHLGSVTHGYRPFGAIGKEHTGNDGDSGSCNNDVNCPEGAPWAAQRNGVVNLLTSNATQYCTGSLIGTVEQDCRNYVLTAYHCANLPSEAAGTIFQFNYERPGCGSGNAPTDRTISGSTLRATYAASDMTLFEMSSDPDAEWDAYYAGWSRSTAAPTESTGIHHPRGDVKKISFNVDPLVDGVNYGPDHWRISEWEDGTTEGGSSGSPLYDQDQRIVGQLHGGTASCSSITWDEYGKLDVSWTGDGTASSRLSDWLDPGGSGAITADGISWADCQAPQPRLRLDGVALDDSQGNGNGVVEPGETIVVTVTERNAGTLDATNVTGTLSTTVPLVAVPDGLADFPDIPQAQSRASLAPHFTAALDPGFACGDAIPFDLRVDATEAPGTWAHAFEVPTGTPQVTTDFADDMESGAGSWVVESLEGANPWSLVTTDSNSPATSWFIDDVPTRSDTVLEMQQQPGLAARSALVFWHRFDTESNWDGGVLEYSTDAGGAWQDAGALMIDGAYSGGISSGASSNLAGRSAWAGDSGGWIRTEVDLSSLAGLDVTLRWRFATDSSVSDVGWWVDDVRVESTTFSCAPPIARPGEASASETFTVEVDPGGFRLAWTAPPGGGPVTGYRLYRTDLAAGAPAVPVCEADLGSGLTAVVPSLTDGAGFMVVAFNDAGEGSYGQESDARERDPATGPDVCP